MQYCPRSDFKVVNIENIQFYSGDPYRLSPLQLAFIGDAAYEILVREYILASNNNLPIKKLHANAVNLVCGAFQSSAYEKVYKELTARELDILKRGRNADTVRTPKSCDIIEYKRATGFEALIGYLYLCRDYKRIREIFDLLVIGEINE